MITQRGAVSVTNPDTTASAEDVSFVVSQAVAPLVYHLRNSSLVRPGETVMTWNRDYLELANLLFQVGKGYAALFPGKSRIQLDFEYKKVALGQLEVKQVREIPPRNQ